MYMSWHSASSRWLFELRNVGLEVPQHGRDLDNEVQTPRVARPRQFVHRVFIPQ
jgi:hypothetical protein